MSEVGSEANKILSDIIVHMKYAKYIPELQRRENWEEICTRNMNMHIKKYPILKESITNTYKNFVFTKKVLPSMRSAQFAGKPIEVNQSRIYNCCFCPIDDLKAFNEIMFLLLGGTGVGYSVQKHHIEKLPEIIKPNSKKTKRYLIPDSIEGWADAIKILMKSYTTSNITIRFDYSDIRAKGERLITAGGKAPGPQPLKDCIHNIRKILDAKENYSNLSPLEAHDIICFIADSVLAGGIRRSALISLFSVNDDEMISCKAGAWWELNPQRGRANNSAVLLRNKLDKNTFLDIWKKIEASGSGEPGIYLSNDKEWGSNPCVEIALRPFQMCNLVEINATDIDTQQEFNDRATAGAFIGTLQAGYTDFHYLRSIWKKTTEKDALLGVSMTGIASNKIFDLNIEEAVTKIKETNEFIADLIGINKSARLTCVKPAGTTSLVLGSSSGIHAWHNDYYIRRVRVGKNEAIYTYLSINASELLEDDLFRPNETAIISIPQKAPINSTTRHENALDLLERIKKVSMEWVKPGHISGQNTHNVSATVSIKDNEWQSVGNWMWDNKKYYAGLSVLPYDNGSYQQAPFEDCTKEEYESKMKLLKSLDLNNVIEVQDDTNLSSELACAGPNGCELV